MSDDRREYKRAWREANRERQAALHRAWYLRNKEAVEERRRRWKADRRAEKQERRAAEQERSTDSLLTRFAETYGLPIGAARRTVAAVAIGQSSVRQIAFARMVDRLAMAEKE